MTHIRKLQYRYEAKLSRRSSKAANQLRCFGCAGWGGNCSVRAASAMASLVT